MITALVVIFIGLLLIFLEVFFIPGIGIVGIAGGLIAMYGIYMIYENHGTLYGNIAFASTLGLGVGAIVIGMRTGLWKRYSLKQTIDAKVNTIDETVFKVDMEGRTLSALRPSGTAIFGTEIIEVHSEGDFIDSGIAIKIKAIQEQKILIEKV